MEVELDVECNNCGINYKMIYDSSDMRYEDPAFHCAFCGILMEPYYDEFFEGDEYE